MHLRSLYRNCYFVTIFIIYCQVFIIKSSIRSNHFLDAFEMLTHDEYYSFPANSCWNCLNDKSRNASTTITPLNWSQSKCPLLVAKKNEFEEEKNTRSEDFSNAKSNSCNWEWKRERGKLFGAHLLERPRMETGGTRATCGLRWAHKTIYRWMNAFARNVMGREALQQQQ